MKLKDDKRRGNVEQEGPKLFQAFSVKLTIIFFMSVFIQSFHISTCKNYAYLCKIATLRAL